MYHAPPAKIDVIAHGIPEVAFAAANSYKDRCGVHGKLVLLTFGLLSPNKGIEHVLHALPKIVAEFPDAVYILLGATHPNELRTRGDAYRLSLEAIVRENKLGDNVVFHNRFVELKELTDFIGAADLYITPYLDEAQITSGTLAYAFGSGKAVVSTPYWHAAELLRDQRGVLVPFADPTAIAREVCGLLRDGPRRKAMSDEAYRLGRAMVWSKTAELYMRSFNAARRQSAASAAAPVAPARPHESPELNLDHLCRMTDATGMFQHANLTMPNPAEGYCTDDNARALLLTVLLGQLEEQPPKRVRSLAATYTAFLRNAFDGKIRRFHDFLSRDRRWLDEQGSEDCQGPAIWALGAAAGGAPSWSLHTVVDRLFEQALPAAASFTSPRAWAFTLLGLHEYLRHNSHDGPANALRKDLMKRLATISTRFPGPAGLGSKTGCPMTTPSWLMR